MSINSILTTIIYYVARTRRWRSLKGILSLFSDQSIMTKSKAVKALESQLEEQEQVIEQIQNDGVELPILDVGIAHGEKARGGALF